MHLVSTIIPTHNRSRKLRQAIESVMNVRRTDFELEIIIVDDGSTDDTAAVASSYTVTYIRTPGLGAAGARNVGIDAAHGDILAFLDDDDVWLPNNIAPQLALLDSHPEYGAAYAQVQQVDVDDVPYGEPIPAGPLRSGWIFEDLLRHWPQIGSLVVRACVAREIQGLDPTLRSEEEWDWLLRIARRHEIGRVEQPVMLFRQRGDADAELAWRRMPYTLRVFHRHTKRYSLYHRLRLQRVLWSHRGWYAASFLRNAQHYAHSGDRLQSLRCLYFAMRASVPHTLAGCARSWPLASRAGP